MANIMNSSLATVVAAVGLFAGTRIDDIVALAVLNMSSRVQGRPKRWQIWVGMYAGMTAVVLLSLLAAIGLTVVPGGWIWVLGLIPLLLGVRSLIITIRAHNVGDPASPAVVTGLTGVIGLTIANGGDDIAAYMPVFRALDAGDVALTIVVFAVGVAAWCLLGAWLASHRRVTQVIQMWGHWIIPAVFILIGLYVFYKAGMFGA
jgi:cadmium resistance protein CadD (predicted permease)